MENEGLLQFTGFCHVKTTDPDHIRSDILSFVCVHDGRFRNPEHMTFILRMGLWTSALIFNNQKWPSAFWWVLSLYQNSSLSLQLSLPISLCDVYVVLFDLWKASYILTALLPVGYSLRAAWAGVVLGPLAVHLWPLSASDTCKCNIGLPWALITSPFNPQPPSLREGFSKWGREKVGADTSPSSLFTPFLSLMVLCYISSL